MSRAECRVAGVRAATRGHRRFLALLAGAAGWSCGAAAGLPPARPAPDPAPLEARDKYLLLDSRVVASVENAVLRVGTVVKHPANPLFGEDRPWEQCSGNIYPNVLFDPEAHLYKMWYETRQAPIAEGRIPWLNDISRGSLAPDLYGPPVTRPNKGPAQWRYLKPIVSQGDLTLLYATSSDGIRWDKPALDVYRYRGGPTNIVMLHTHATGVFRDDHDPDPARRYKLINSVQPTPGGRIHVAYSADGISWGDLADTLVTAGADTHQTALWDPETRRYIAYSRGWAGGALGWNLPPMPVPWDELAGKGVRTVIRIESPDFVHWSAPEEVLRSPIASQFHDLHVFRYAGVYLALSAILGVGDAPRRVQAELLWSPDSRTWHRIDEGHALIPLSDNEGACDWGCVFPASSPIVTPQGIRLYYCGSPEPMAFGPKFQCLATLRLDGWAGYEPRDAEQPARIVSHPVVCSAPLLRVSADVAPGGTLRLSVLGANGTALVDGREIGESVTDAAAADLSRCVGTTVRIRIEMRRAKVFAFAFAR